MTPSRVDFYLLKDDDAGEKLRYACRIAGKAFGQGLKTHLRTENPAQSEALDQLLWTFSQSSFVPHAIHDDGPVDIDRYPVLIGNGAAPPGCRELLISVCSEVPDDYDSYDRIADLVSAQEEDRARGRARFRFYRDRGVELKTHDIS